MNDFRRILEELDISGFALISRALGMKFKDDASAEVTMHHARTQVEAISFDMRAYSHAWLTERGFPSGLPDELRPRAQRLYPVVAEAVGVSVRGLGNVVTPLSDVVERAMSDAVAECYADGERRSDIVKARMAEARHKAMAS